MRVVPRILLGLSLAGLPTRAAAQTYAVSTAKEPLSTDAVARFTPLAQKIVQQANLRPDQSVIVRGSLKYLPLMEEMAAEFERSGIMPLMILQTDKLENMGITQRSEAAQLLPPSPLRQALYEKADLWVVFPGTSDPSAYPPLTEQQARINNQSLTVWAPWVSKRRAIFLNFPVPADTAFTGMSFAQLDNVIWSAMNADYSRIGSEAEALRRQVVNARHITIISPQGTNLTFAPDGQRAFLDVGLASTDPSTGKTANERFLPGGLLTVFAAQPNANGKVRALADHCAAMVRDERIEVVNGKAGNVHTASDEACVVSALKDMSFIAFGIGLNPSVPFRATDTGIYMDPASEGLVTFFFGKPSPVGQPVGDRGQWQVPIEHATVTADGVVILRDGKLIQNRLGSK